MIRWLFSGLIVIASLLPFAEIYANRYLVVVTNNSENFLVGYPGQCWAKTADKIYLDAYDSDMEWLNANSVIYKTAILPDDIEVLYINYFNSINFDYGNSSGLDFGPGYILSIAKNPKATFISTLFPEKLPFGRHPRIYSNAALSYNPMIDSLLDLVNQDSLLSYLSKLSGELPIDVNGQLDTILARFANTPDNLLAGDYLASLLEHFGYQVEYHKFLCSEFAAVKSKGSNYCWAVAEFDGQLFRTTNAGLSWKTRKLNYSIYNPAITVVGLDSIWISASCDTLLFSPNGGDSIIPQYIGLHASILDCDFISPTKGFMSTSYGGILSSTDAGMSWSPLSLPVNNVFTSMSFVDTAYGWAVGLNGVILATSDGGSSWTQQNSSTANQLNCVDFSDQNNGWAVGIDVVCHTTNGGGTWQNDPTFLPHYYWRVDFYDNLRGCIIVRHGSALLTTDGGITWQNRTPITGSYGLMGMTMTDSTSLILCAKNTLLKTNDFGTTWLDQAGNIENGPKNIIATKTGVGLPEHQIIVCGHYDVASNTLIRGPGADDNGSGTIGVIEIARILKNKNFLKTIKFCLWNGEEYGMVGSRAYVRDAYLRNDQIEAAINLDMIAYDGNEDDSIDLHCGVLEENVALGMMISQIISEYGLGLNPEILTSSATGASDHSSFWNYGYHALLAIENYGGDFNPYYHSSDDNIAHIRMNYYYNYTKAALGAISELAVPIGACDYRVGDINNDGTVIGSDVTYGVRYFKGIGPSPEIYCYNDLIPEDHLLYVAGDVNNDCMFRGSDITRLVAYFKGVGILSPCHLFPPR
jgi:hypothetical protein